MKVILPEKPEKELDKMDKSIQILFAKHIDKIKEHPPKRHLRFGIPYNVENVTKQARIILDVGSTEIYVVHCFATHKEYENWYKSFR